MRTEESTRSEQVTGLIVARTIIVTVLLALIGAFLG